MKYFHQTLLSLFVLILVWIVGQVLKEAGVYYLTDPLHRPHIAAHQLWKPGGLYGHGLGIIGGSMMILMFIYSLRKRVKLFRKWGKLPTWLNYHIFMGIAGPVLVTFHTAFKFGGLVSISYWSMVAVALSGFIGRYIYIKIPHHVSGKEVNRSAFKNRLDRITEQFKNEFGISESTLEKIHKISGAAKIEKRGLFGIFTILIMDITGWFKWRKIKKDIQESSSVARDEFRHFKLSLREIVKMDRQIAFWTAAHRLFHYWHVIHKPFAYTMIVIMLIHVVIAISLGYSWIF